MSAVLLMSISLVETKLFENDSRVNIFRVCYVVKSENQDFNSQRERKTVFASSLGLFSKTAEKNSEGRTYRSKQRMANNCYHSLQHLFSRNV